MCCTLSWLTMWLWHRLPMSRMSWALKPNTGWVSAPPGLVKEKSCAAVNTFLLVLPNKWTSFKRSGNDREDIRRIYTLHTRWEWEKETKKEREMHAGITPMFKVWHQSWTDDRRVCEECRLCLSAVSCNLSEVSVSYSAPLKWLLCVLNGKGGKGI